MLVVVVDVVEVVGVVVLVCVAVCGCASGCFVSDFLLVIAVDGWISSNFANFLSS